MNLGNLGLKLGNSNNGPRSRELRVKTEANPNAYETYRLADGQIYLVKRES